MNRITDIEFANAICESQLLMNKLLRFVRDSRSPDIPDILAVCIQLKSNILSIEDYALQRRLEDERRKLGIKS